jgi:predicted DNA-binding protein
MVPPTLRDRLKALSHEKRVPQSHYHREAARYVVATYGQPGSPPFPVRFGRDANLVSIVFRLGEPDLHEGIRALCERTRVPLGEYMRVGLEHVVSTHEGPAVSLAVRLGQVLDAAERLALEAAS